MQRFSWGHMAAALAVLLVGGEVRAADPSAPVRAPVAAPKPLARPKSAPSPVPQRRRHVKAPERTFAPGTPIASYAAFRLLDDGSTRVAVEVTRKVVITERRIEGRIVYRLAGAAVPGNNAHLPLPTGFFATPVQRVSLVEVGNGADLVIELREAATPTFRVLETPRGVVLQVDLPRPAGVIGVDAAPKEA